jgi:hypothetical protein
LCKKNTSRHPIKTTKNQTNTHKNNNKNKNKTTKQNKNETTITPPLVLM